MAKAAAKGRRRARPANGNGYHGNGDGSMPMAQAGLFSHTNKMVLLLTAIALVPFSLPTLFLLFCGMLPTLAAAFGARSGGRAWMSVAGLNFAGLSPWLLQLWFGHHTLDYAWSEIASVVPLLAAYGGAAAGWALHLMMAPVVGTFLSFRSQRKVSQLAAQQKKLVEIWGEEVISRESSSAPGAL